jgi:hypothetical protein
MVSPGWAALVNKIGDESLPCCAAAGPLVFEFDVKMPRRDGTTEMVYAALVWPL